MPVTVVLIPGFLKMKIRYLITPVLIAFLLFLSACTGKNSAADAVTGYYQALIDRDYTQMIDKSCVAWESQAKTEFDSFAAVTATLENLSCQEIGKQGEYSEVACSGKIVANYGNEVLEIDLSSQTYLALYEYDDWRMCGYSQ